MYQLRRCAECAQRADVRIALPVRRPSFCRHRSCRPRGHPTYVRA
jgi:hypothetical protein